MAREVVLTVFLLVVQSAAQDLQPRRWSHLPVDSNFIGTSYAYTFADIYFDPAQRIENAELDLHSYALSYLRSFEVLGKSARFDLIQGYQYGRWAGLLNGNMASTSRSGLSDTLLRFSMNLYGAPPLKGSEFAAYRASKRDCETIVGIGLSAQLPTGYYLKNRLLNLGSNRFTFRPQLGIVHNRGPWSFEFTSGVWLYTDNQSFSSGNTLEQDPLFSLQGHLVYTFRPGLWLATGAAWGSGGRTSINGSRNDDNKNNFLWGASIGIPVTRQFGFRITYVSTNTAERAGFDSNTFSLGASLMW